MSEARWSGPTAHTFLRNFYLHVGVKLTNDVVVVSTVDRVTQLYIYMYLFLKEISPEHSLEGLMLKLKRQYFGHLMRRASSLEKTLMLGKTEDKKEKGATEDAMVRWHQRVNGHDFERTPRNSGGRIMACAPSLPCC